MECATEWAIATATADPRMAQASVRFRPRRTPNRTRCTARTTTSCTTPRTSGRWNPRSVRGLRPRCSPMSSATVPRRCWTGCRSHRSCPNSRPIASPVRGCRGSRAAALWVWAIVPASTESVGPAPGDTLTADCLIGATAHDLLTPAVPRISATDLDAILTAVVAAVVANARVNEPLARVASIRRGLESGRSTCR